MSLLPFFIAWVILGGVVATLAFMRKAIASKEDDSLHLAGGGAVIVDQQASIAKRLEAVDRWGKLLTIVLAVSGLILAIIYGVQIWNQATNAGIK
jgi:cytochrome b subunit of formate dehydrogenase